MTSLLPALSALLLAAQFATAAPQGPAAVRVALWNGGGCSARCVAAMTKGFTGPQFYVEVVDAAAVAAGALARFDVVVFPGGSASKQAAALGVAGRERVREFVRDGGGYLGICAGNYLAASNYSWSLGLLAVDVIDRQHWKRGRGDVAVELSAAGGALFGAREQAFDVRYANGPLLALRDVEGLAAPEVLAWYRGEVRQNDAPEGVMRDTPAMLRGRYGDGRVLCSSPHPELTDGLDGMVRAATQWLASRGETPRSTPFVSGEHGYHTFRIPAFVVAGDGALLAICEGRRGGRGDAGEIDLVARRSDDGGRTWGALQVVQDDGANTCGNPCPVLDAATGTLWLLSTWNRGDDHERDIIAQKSKDTRRVFVSSSRDHGRTWSERREITAQVKRDDWTWYATGPGCGIQLVCGEHRGRLVIPCDHIEASTKHYYSHVIFSDDHGETWQLGGSTPRHQVNECEVAECVDGSLLLNMRSYDPSAKCRQQARSKDGGATWAQQTLLAELVDPICQASLRRLSWPSGEGERVQPGTMLFCNAASTKRERLTLRTSHDDGHTWSDGLLLAAGPSAYSCLVILPDGSVGVACERGEKGPYERIDFVVVPADRLVADD
ncbi:MAG: exo-alpha-sialidase [Planctomycetota bacterium]